MKTFLLALALLGHTACLLGQTFPGEGHYNGGFVPTGVTQEEVIANSCGSHPLPQVVADGMKEANYALAFHAEWCGPCKQMTPVIAKLKAEGYVIYDVDIDKDKDALRQCGLAIDSIPTIMIFDKGSMIHRYVGVISADTLKRHLVKKADQPQPKKKVVIADPPPAPKPILVPVEAPKPPAKKARYCLS